MGIVSRYGMKPGFFDNRNGNGSWNSPGLRSFGPDRPPLRISGDTAHGTYLGDRKPAQRIAGEFRPATETPMMALSPEGDDNASRMKAVGYGPDYEVGYGEVTSRPGRRQFPKTRFKPSPLDEDDFDEFKNRLYSPTANERDLHRGEDDFENGIRAHKQQYRRL
jgi:hypothetical protein